MRLIRYADDFVVMVRGAHNDAEALRDEIAAVLAPMGLRLSAAKTRVCHIDEGFDFLGWRIQRRSWRSRTSKKAVYTYPSKKSLASVVGKVPVLRAVPPIRRCCRRWWLLLTSRSRNCGRWRISNHAMFERVQWCDGMEIYISCCPAWWAVRSQRSTNWACWRMR